MTDYAANAIGHDAPQHGPRPLPLFLDLLRSETAASPARREAALAGLRAYQTVLRPAPRPAKPVVARAGRAALLDYGGWGPPIVFVPSLINPPRVLDLARGNSLLRWLARQGVHPYLVDWGKPGRQDRGDDIDACVTGLLVPLLRTLPSPPIVAGYCLGGTIAAAAAHLTPVGGLAMIAAPWRFSGFASAQLDEIRALWESARPACRQLGLVPMEVLQSGFWKLDPARTIAKFERFGRLAPGSPDARGFVALEDWANQGAPLPLAAGEQMFEHFFMADLPGSGRWAPGGIAIDPTKLPVPTIEFVSETDRIVPAASAAGLADQRRLSLGHVGMIVGGRARAALWEPLADWCRRVHAAR